MMEGILQWGVAVVLVLQGLGDWLRGPMNVITFAGSTEFYLLVLPALYWCWDSRLGLRVGVGLMLSGCLNGILKMVLHAPRPYWLDSRARLLTGPETSFGIPSGHAQNTTVLWGVVGAGLRGKWAPYAALVLILLVGLSRIYLGVHFPTDVLAGWGIGAVVLALVLYLERPATAWLARLAPARQVVVLFGVSAAIAIAGGLVGGAVSASWQVPAAWSRNAIAIAPEHPPLEPFSMDTQILCAAAFFGLTAGSIWMEARGGFDAKGAWLKRLARYLVGVVGVLVLWKGLGALFSLLAPEQTLPGYVLRYVRYALIGAWVSALGPLVFIRLKLARVPTGRENG